MSHFTVAVIGENPEALLAPYQENNMDDCPSEFLAFHDETDEVVENWENPSVSVFTDPEGEHYFKYSDEFKQRDPSDSGPFPRNIYVCPEGWTENEVPANLMYDTIEEYAKDYYGYEANEDGRFGYWENPEAKWDWYQLGGRWRGYFRLKPEFDGAGVVGQAGVFGNDVASNLHVDQARKYQIDFESMINDRREWAAEDYDFISGLFPNGEIPKIEKSWKEFQADVESGTLESYDVARDQYWAQPSLVEWKRVMDEARSRDDLTDSQKSKVVWNDAKDYQMTREEYIDHHGARAIATFAVVTEDGKWHEKGSMGWWGMVSDEKDATDWVAEFQKLVMSLPDETLISVYDCHI